MKTAIAPEDEAAEDRAAAEHRAGRRRARPDLPSLSRPTAAALVPGGGRARCRSAVLPQAARCGTSARTIAGAWLLRRLLEGLRADQHADVEQDRQRWRRPGSSASITEMMPNQREHDHHDAGRGRVADAPAHRLPARMADVDGVDERIAHQAADQADDAVGGQHARGREAVAGHRRALDVVHRLDQVVDAEGNRGDQDDAEELEAARRRGRRPGSAREKPKLATDAVSLSSVMPPKLRPTAVEPQAMSGADRDGDQAGRDALR